jgi:hypothetical protein
MDISRLYQRVGADRDHHAMMCVEYCNRQLWDLAAKEAKLFELLDAKLIAIIEGRGADYGIRDDSPSVDPDSNVTAIRP